MWDSLKVGQKVIVTHNDGRRFAGTLELVDSKRIQLVDLTQLDIAKKVGFRFKYFNKNDIQYVESENDEYDSGCSFNDEQWKEWRNLDYIEKMIENKVIINGVDQTYFEAIEDIKNQYVIGISAGIVTRSLKIKHLAVATASKIYIFNLSILEYREGADLRDVLESNEITKIVYDGRELKMSLEMFQQIKLVSDFDAFCIAALVHPTYIFKNFGTLVLCDLKVDKHFHSYDDNPSQAAHFQDIAQRAAYLVPLYYHLSASHFKKFIPSWESYYDFKFVNPNNDDDYVQQIQEMCDDQFKQPSGSKTIN